MNNEWLFVTKNEYTTTNIPDSYMPAKLQMLKTRHMTLTTDIEHNTEFYIQLRKINLGECTATFDVGLYGHITSFKIGIDDDPIIRFIDDDPIVHHVFENACSYEINNHIKTNTLYKLQKQGNTDFQLVIATNVTSHTVNFNELRFPNNIKCVVIGHKIDSTDAYDIDMYKEYIVTEIGPLSLINTKIGIKNI